MVPDSVSPHETLNDASERRQATKSQFLLGNTFCYSDLRMRDGSEETGLSHGYCSSSSRIFEQEVAPLCGRKLYSIQPRHPKCSTKDEGALSALPSTPSLQAVSLPDVGGCTGGLVAETQARI